MSQLQRAIQREVDDFISKIREPEASLVRVSKAAFTKARKKLKPDAFIELGQIVIESFYTHAPFKKDWKGFRLLAGDGSTLELPNSKDIQEEYKVFKYRQDGKAICLARTFQIFDPLNHLTLDARIAPFKTSESELCWQYLKGSKVDKNDLFIFDRYFASYLLIFYLSGKGANYCFRMKNDWWKIVEKFTKSSEKDSIVELQLPSKDLISAKELGITRRSLKCRLVKITLDSGETEILLTSLLDQNQYSLQDLQDLYHLRWGVEESYKVLKHRICIENFSGKTAKSIQQDFYAKIFMMNLTATLVSPVDKLLEEKPKKKFIHKVNRTAALSKMKWVPILLFLKKNVEKTIGELHQWFLNTTEPIRPGRKYKRHKQPKRKYHQTYKPI